mmetsp:Transcript_22739/g.53825  ORF Transcript_22739/g.53825 Transcript_22739/m.53825 type:complete len:184 (-) Transcript_22739:153-704(-)
MYTVFALSALGLFARPLAPTGRGTCGSVVANGLTRRAALVLAPSVLAVGSVALPALAATDTEKALIAELRDCAERLKPLAEMIEKEQWDPVRSVLKTPPVANLWNLGMSKNQIRKLSDARGGDVDIVEYVEEVGGALQLVDQFVYDNVFIPTQPGNGKINKKAPQDQLKLARKKLDEVLALVE